MPRSTARRTSRRGPLMRSWPATVLAVVALGLSVPCGVAWAAGKGKQDDHHAEDSHAGHHEIGDVNWIYGLLGESDDPHDEPTLLVRPQGMPVPVAAMVFNTLVLFWLLVALGKKPLREALRKRKERIMRGIEDAARMKQEAATRLDEYQAKLANIDDEIERIKEEMRHAAETERDRIVKEAEERRQRMERDAHLLFEQELKAAREALRVQTVEHAVKAAEDLLRARIDEATEQKQRAVYLEEVEKAVSRASFRGHS